MVAKGDSLADILDSLCLLVEEQSSGVLASILLMDPNGKQLRHGAAPNLPQAYTTQSTALSLALPSAHAVQPDTALNRSSCPTSLPIRCGMTFAIWLWHIRFVLVGQRRFSPRTGK